MTAPHSRTHRLAYVSTHLGVGWGSERPPSVRRPVAQVFATSEEENARRAMAAAFTQVSTRLLRTEGQ